jgi:hypothetical protein
LLVLFLDKTEQQLLLDLQRAVKQKNTVNNQLVAGSAVTGH